MTATRQDIDACFRLLLGRSIHAEEAGHYSLIGTPLAAVVASYLRSLEFQNRGLLTAHHRAELVTLERFGIYVDADDPLIAPGIRAGHYEPAVTRAFLDHLRPGCGILDIGANCGYFSLLACSLGAEVWAFEPLPRNLRLLAASRAVNRYEHLHILAAAASDVPGTLVIGASYTDGIVGPAPEAPEAALAADYVAAVRPDDCVPPDARVSVIKIDVEGHEFRALSGARRIIERSRPVILTEFWPAALKANSRVPARDYLHLIESWGYRIALIGEPAVNTTESILDRCAGIDHVDLIAVP